MTLTVPPDVEDVINLNAAINDDQEILVPPEQRQGPPRSAALRSLPSQVEQPARYATSREINMRLVARALVVANVAANRLVS